MDSPTATPGKSFTPTAAGIRKKRTGKPDNLSSLKALFPNASLSFLKLHGFVDDDQAPVASALCHPKPQQDAGSKPLDPDQAEKGSPAGGTGRIKVTITRRGPKLLDVDNLAGGCKPLIDALRYEGVIPNDDPGTIELAFRQFKTRREDQGTEVLIEPCP
jgi:hypothetical protein